jgi:hypothetical protein
VLGAVDERDPPAAAAMEMSYGLRGALARMRPHGVDRRPLGWPADHDDGHGRVAQLVGVRLGQVDRREDQAVDEAVLQVAHHRELVFRVGAGRVEHQAPAASAGHVLDRRDHGRVDRVADVGHGEGDLARPPRAQRPGGCVRHVADLLGGLRHALVRVRVRADPVEHA